MTAPAKTPLGRATSVEWYTPPWIFDALHDRFDLDPASPGRGVVPWIPATCHYTAEEDGLRAPWNGLVWLNPPYGPGIAAWVDRMIAHGNGVALLPGNTASSWFQRAGREAAAICFIRKRVSFLGPAKRPSMTPVASSVLFFFCRNLSLSGTWRIALMAERAEKELGFVVHPRARMVDR